MLHPLILKAIEKSMPEYANSPARLVEVIKEEMRVNYRDEFIINALNSFYTDKALEKEAEIEVEFHIMDSYNHLLVVLEELKEEVEEEAQEVEVVATSPKSSPEYLYKQAVIQNAAELAKQSIHAVGEDFIKFLDFDPATRSWKIPTDGNKPTIEESENLAVKALALHESASMLDSESSWILGNVIAILRDLHGDTFDISKIMESTGKAYNTVKTTESVFRHFVGNRIPGLSFSHHKEVLFHKGLEPENKIHVLVAAKEHALSIKDMRALCKARKGITEESPFEPEEVKELIANKQIELKNEYILIKENGEKRTHKGSMTDTILINHCWIMMTHPRIEIIKGGITSD